MDQTTQAKYLELESLRSRKPLFQRLRIALTSNRDLVGKLKSQNGKIGQLKREAKLLDSMLASLEEEQLLVREKTQALLQRYKAESGIEGIEGKGGEEERPSWVERATSRIFDMFDKDCDGVLSTHEMNQLQASLGSSETYSPQTYQSMCSAAGAEWARGTRKVPIRKVVAGGHSGDSKPRISSSDFQFGVTAKGLTVLYAAMGLQSLLKDLRQLGIPTEMVAEQSRALESIEGLLDRLQYQCKEEKALRRTAERESKAAQEEAEGLKVQLKDALYRVSQLEQSKAEGEEREANLVKALKDAEHKQTQLLETISTMESEHRHMVNSLRDMDDLLKQKLIEKEHLQRALWEAEQANSRSNEVVRQSQALAWEEVQKRKEESRQVRMLYLKLHPSVGSRPAWKPT